MTKSRAPITIENTLYRVLGTLGIERAAAATGRAESYLRALSDPDKRERLTVEDAIHLDMEHRAQGGGGFPLFEAMGRMLDAANAERFAAPAAIALLAIDHAREAGQATAALIEAAQPGACQDTIDRALRELEEDDAAGHAAIAALRELRARPPDPLAELPP